MLGTFFKETLGHEQIAKQAAPGCSSEALGIDENEPNPFGGFFERVPGSGVLNGVVHEYAEHLVRRRFAEQLSDHEIATIYRTFAERALQLGFTSVQNMSVGLQHQRSVEILRTVNPPLRWREICFPLTLQEPCFSGPPPAPLVSPSGIKWIGDCTPVERLAFLGEPYADRPSTRGRFNFPVVRFRDMVERGLHGPRQRDQLLFHLVGDAAIDNLLDAMESLAPPSVWRSRRVRIEHGDLLRPEDVRRVRRLGIVVVQNPTHLSLPDLPSGSPRRGWRRRSRSALSSRPASPWPWGPTGSAGRSVPSSTSSWRASIRPVRERR